jgi:hypothetical protein
MKTMKSRCLCVTLDLCEGPPSLHTFACLCGRRASCVGLCSSSKLDHRALLVLGWRLKHKIWQSLFIWAIIRWKFLVSYWLPHLRMIQLGLTTACHFKLHTLGLWNLISSHFKLQRSVPALPIKLVVIARRNDVAIFHSSYLTLNT